LDCCRPEDRLPGDDVDVPLNPFDPEKHHIALGASEGPRSINYQDIAPEIIMPYWYRLGEAGPWPSATTPSFAKDSSIHARHLTAQGTADTFAGLTVPTLGIPGGFTDDDDGAMQFNSNIRTTTSSFFPLMLGGGYPNMEAPFRVGYGGTPPVGVGGGSTFACWVAFQPAGPGDSAWPDHVAEQTAAYALVSTWARDFGIGNRGCKLGFSPATGKLSYMVGQANLDNYFLWETPGGMVPGEWNHFACTMQRIGTNLYQRKIFLNAIKVLDVTGVLNSPEIGDGAVSGAGLSIGGGYWNDIWFESGRGRVDEVVYWEGVLTEQQIMEVWQAGKSVVDPLTFYGFTLENAYAKFMQRELPPGSRDVGGALDLIPPRAEESHWTQDEFTGGTFQFRYDTDAAMFADCTGYVPSQQAKSLCTVPPVFFKKAFDPTAQANPAGRSNLTNPSSMFTVAGSIFLCFEHGILRYITGTDSFVWGNPHLTDAYHWYVGAEYDKNEQCIYILINRDDPGRRPYFLRVDPETFALWGSHNQYFDNAPVRTEDSPAWGFQINDQNLVVGIGWRLYTVDPPEKPQDPTDAALWTHIGRLPGRWVDSVAYNGMTYILTATADGKTFIVAFDGTYVLPIAQMAFNFRGTCMTVYGGRVYIGGSGTDINGVDRYAELHELTGSSTRLVRTFAPESRQSRVTYPKQIWDLTVAEGLLWWSEKNKRLWTYDLTGDAFFGSCVIQHPGVNFYRQVVGRERLWLWGAHDTIAGQHGFYRIPISGDTVAGYEGLLVTSDFANDFALDKKWREMVVLTRYYPATAVDYSTDGGATWASISLAGGSSTGGGDLHLLTVDLSVLPPSRMIRFRIHQAMGTAVDVFGELIAFTVAFTVQEEEKPLKHGWNIVINGAENVEARDGSNQYQDVDAMKAMFWGWAETRTELTYRDLGGKDYLVKMQDFVEQQPIIGPNVTNGVNPEAYFAITLVETVGDD
jgi:Concanavalin A-like lectin/glucanases superfamily